MNEFRQTVQRGAVSKEDVVNLRKSYKVCVCYFIPLSLFCLNLAFFIFQIGNGAGYK